jgi:hypothetical protein
MGMPEAPMNLDALAASREGDIGPAGHPSELYPEAVPKPMQQATDNQFGFGVRSADA